MKKHVKTDHYSLRGDTLFWGVRKNKIYGLWSSSVYPHLCEIVITWCSYTAALLILQGYN